MKNSSNQQFASIIKLRHLSNAVRNNWVMLEQTRSSVDRLLEDAGAIMLETGTPLGKTTFEGDRFQLKEAIHQVQQQLVIFAQFIETGSMPEQDLQNAWSVFNDAIRSAEKFFVYISKYPGHYFVDSDALETWEEIWSVIRSNIYVVQGLGEAAYIKVVMMQKLRVDEIDSLLKSIAAHIPGSFNMLDADQYRMEYLQAMKEIEEESNKKDNLWDRFLNLLAGSIPFKQTPEERVMMRRWLEGERGEL